VLVLSHRNVQLGIPRVLSNCQSDSNSSLSFVDWIHLVPDGEGREQSPESGRMDVLLIPLLDDLGPIPGSVGISAGTTQWSKKRDAHQGLRFSAYFFARLVGDAPLEMLELVLPSIYLCIYYPMMGGTCSAFVGIFISQMLSSMASQSVGHFFTCVMEVEAATTIATIFTVAAQLLGGYLSTNISAY
jgi:hypothetical protein